MVNFIKRFDIDIVSGWETLKRKISRLFCLLLLKIGRVSFKVERRQPTHKKVENRKITNSSNFYCLKLETVLVNGIVLNNVNANESSAHAPPHKCRSCELQIHYASASMSTQLRT